MDDGNMIWQSDANPPSPFAVWRRAVYHMAVGKRGEWDRLLRCECASTGVENGGAGRCLTATLYNEFSLNLDDAKRVHQYYSKQGYDDVQIVELETGCAYGC